ncbi:MAG: hypothetical protein HUJ31_11130, partial [Pseudomonadales bacterium]|nr:hypothetical protein [Pseudomonadales bacterium]
LITAECNDAPHAPWWHHDPDWWKAAEFLANPGAEVISHYLTFGNRPGELEGLLVRAVDHLQHADLEMHELLCFLRLAENRKLDAAWRDRLASPVFREARKLVKVAPAQWEEYCLMPVSVVDSPDSLLAGFFGPALDESIDWLIGQQKEDGRWAPAWSWGGEYPDTWADVEKEISAALTLQTLIKLDRFHRLPRAL